MGCRLEAHSEIRVSDERSDCKRRHRNYAETLLSHQLGVPDKNLSVYELFS